MKAFLVLRSGGGGIRTHEAPYDAQRFSRRCRGTLGICPCAGSSRERVSLRAIDLRSAQSDGRFGSFKSRIAVSAQCGVSRQRETKPGPQHRSSLGCRSAPAVSEAAAGVPVTPWRIRLTPVLAIVSSMGRGGRSPTSTSSRSCGDDSRRRALPSARCRGFMPERLLLQPAPTSRRAARPASQATVHRAGSGRVCQPTSSPGRFPPGCWRPARRPRRAWSGRRS
jgi:hypothetical protein